MKRNYARILCLLLAAFLLCGCTQQNESPAASTEPPAAESSDGQRLHITVVPEPGASKLIRTSELGGNLYDGLAYIDVSDVTIDVGSETLALENAIRDGKITTAEIFAFARIDAQNGVCRESFSSVHGLTHFLYVYPDFELDLAYDVLETPDGKQHLIEDVTISSVPNPSTIYRDRSYFYVDEESKFGDLLDREDWGITFEIASVTPTQITLDYTQSGGQQIGELEVDFNYTVYSIANDQVTPLPSLQGSVIYTQENLPSPITTIKQNGTSQFTIDWTEKYGELESGEYRIRLTINDIFDESQVHPLMQDYYDRQGYWIEFTIS